jgi:hypothetical protein
VVAFTDATAKHASDLHQGPSSALLDGDYPAQHDCQSEAWNEIQKCILVSIYHLIQIANFARTPSFAVNSCSFDLSRLSEFSANAM